MTTKWISQIFSGGAGTKNVITAPSGGGEAEGDDKPNIPKQAASVKPTAQAAPPSGTSAPQEEESIDYSKSVVLLLYGKNSFGDQIYSYLKITLGGIEKLKAAVLVGIPFNPSDFGTVIAAGRGEPTDEVRAEISSQYYILTPQAEDTPPPAATISEKKGWDEY